MTDFWPDVQHWSSDTSTWLTELQGRFDRAARYLAGTDGADTTQLKKVLAELYSIEDDLKSVVGTNLYELDLALEHHVDELEAEPEW